MQEEEPNFKNKRHKNTKNFILNNPLNFISIYKVNSN